MDAVSPPAVCPSPSSLCTPQSAGERAGGRKGEIQDSVSSCIHSTPVCRAPAPVTEDTPATVQGAGARLSAFFNTVLLTPDRPQHPWGSEGGCSLKHRWLSPPPVSDSASLELGGHPPKVAYVASPQAATAFDQKTHLENHRRNNRKAARPKPSSSWSPGKWTEHRPGPQGTGPAARWDTELAQRPRGADPSCGDSVLDEGAGPV